MKKILSILFLLFTALTSSAQYNVVRIYTDSIYRDYVIVYGYYQSDGTYTLSHCRTNKLGPGVDLQRTYLDVNTCMIKVYADDNNI